MEQIGRHDRSLEDQLRRAGASVALNVAEGSGARGKNRGLRYSTALGSARETRACLQVAGALGYVTSVDAAVLASLQSLFPVDSWRETSRYMISRALIHGRRRAEEMREAANTVAEAGVSARMSQACVEWEEWASHRSEAATHQHIDAMLDALQPSGGPASC